MINLVQITTLLRADNFCDQRKLYAEPDPAFIEKSSRTGVKLYRGASPRGSNERSEAAQ